MDSAKRDLKNFFGDLEALKGRIEGIDTNGISDGETKSRLLREIEALAQEYEFV